MWSFIVRKLIYNIPVYLGIVLLMMLALRVRDPVYSYLGKNASQEQIDRLSENMGLSDPFIVQYVKYMGRVVTLDFSEESWFQQGTPVGEILTRSIPPSLSITVPTLGLSAFCGVCIALVSSYFRGRAIDRSLMVLAVVGMSVSYLVYIIFGQFFGAFLPRQQVGPENWPFAIEGYEPWLFGEGASPMNWVTYCMLPVLIGLVVAVGYDTRFYRAVMVEESTKDYITTAMAKGAGKRKIIFVHMLKNAMIPIITRIMATLPFLITGAVLVEYYFRIPGMGFQLIFAIQNNDFPVIQALVVVLAAIFILTVILTDVLYALVDPRVRLS
jgi:peptide/nickel transport system permease protein